MTALTLIDCRITNAVRCVPPENKPTPHEITTCRDFLVATIAEMPRLARRCRARPRRARNPRRRAERPAPRVISLCPRRRTQLGGIKLFDSYHCSRYNTYTGVLTPQMFRDVFAEVRKFLDAAV